MTDWNLRSGDRVLLRQLPPGFADMPARKQDVLDLCLGRELEVCGLDDHGNVELDVSRVTQRGVGALTQTVFVDSRCVQRLD